MAKIYHIKGNVLHLTIIMGMSSDTNTDGIVSQNVTEFVPNTDYPVIVVLKYGVVKRRYEADVDGNTISVDDPGTLPLGTYSVEVLCRDSGGNKMRFRQDTVIEVVDATADGGVYNTDEYDVDVNYPVIYGHVSAISMDETHVTLTAGLTFLGDQDDTDDYEDITATDGEGYVAVENDNITLYNV